MTIIAAPDFSRRPVPVLFHRQQGSVEEGRLTHARHPQGSSRPNLGVAVAVTAPVATAVAFPLPWASDVRTETTLIVLVFDSTVARPVPLLRPLTLVAEAMAGRVALVGLLRA